MTSNEAEQQLYETAVRLVRGYAEHLPMLDDDGPRTVTGLALEALLVQWGVPQAVASVHGAVSMDDVAKLLRRFKDNVWDVVAQEKS